MVESQLIPFAQYGVSLQFFGQLDALVATEDGEIWIVDYKTTTLDDTALIKFRRQLSCYLTAIEHPKRASHGLPCHINGMAILVFNPAIFKMSAERKRCGLYGDTRWLELPRRDDLFQTFLEGVVSALAAVEAPKPTPTCGICRLRFDRPNVSL